MNSAMTKLATLVERAVEGSGGQPAYTLPVQFDLSAPCGPSNRSNDPPLPRKGFQIPSAACLGWPPYMVPVAAGRSGFLRASGQPKAAIVPHTKSGG